jgi:hypothetical protein
MGRLKKLGHTNVIKHTNREPLKGFLTTRKYPPLSKEFENNAENNCAPMFLRQAIFFPNLPKFVFNRSLWNIDGMN